MSTHETTPTQSQTLDASDPTRDELHRFYNKISGSVQGLHCGRSSIAGKSGQVIKRITTTDGRRFAGFSQPQSCSPTTCILGHANSASQHQEELQHVLTQHFEAGGGILFGTFTLKAASCSTPRGFSSLDIGVRTLPQYAGIKNSASSAAEKKQQLNKLREDFERVAQPNSWTQGWRVNEQLQAVREGLSKMFVGTVWSKESRQMGVIGRATSIEIVLHPHPDPNILWKRVRANLHVHFLLLTRVPTADESKVTSLKKSLHTRWSRALAKHGFASRLTHQQLVIASPTLDTAARLSSYIPKGSLNEKPSDETQRQGRSLFAPLIDAATAHHHGAPPPAGAVVLFKNLEALLSGLHLYRLTPSLLARYGVKELRADRKQQAKARIKSVEEMVLVERKHWTKLDKESPELLPLIKEAAKGFNAAEEVSGLLSVLNIPHILMQAPKKPSPE